MLQRIILWGVRSYIRGPGRSWLYTTLTLAGLRLVRRIAGRRPVTETLRVKPGDKVTVEHLEISHRRQIKQIKRQRRRERLAERRARRARSD